MKILLLGTKGVRHDNDQYYDEYVDFFQAAATTSGTGLEVVYALVDDLFIAVGDGTFSIRDTRNDADLSEYKAVLIRGHVHQHVDVIKAVSVYLKRSGVSVINDYSGYRSSSKLVQAVQLHESGLPVASTVFVTSAVLKNLSSLPFAMPCIMKATNGSHGNFNYKVASLSDIENHMMHDSDRDFVLQRYMPNQADYRILLIGSEVMIIKRSAPAGTHLNNTSQGGNAELVNVSELPEQVIEQSRLIAAQMGMTIAGVDVLYDTAQESYSFLEINAQPQLMTGAFIQEKGALISAYFKSL